MAEIFATGSAAIGVAAAIGQLIDGVTKLRAFCQDVQEIAEDFQSAVENLASLADVLDIVRIEINQNCSLEGANFEVPRKILASLEESSQDVGEVLQEMEAKLAKKRKGGRIRALDLKRKLEKSVKRVQEARDLLMMTLVIGNRTLFRRGFENQQQGFMSLSGLIATQSTSNRIDRKAKTQFQISTSTPAGMEHDASLIRQSGERANLIRSANFWTLHVRAPYWLFSYAFEISFRQACPGWDFSFRPYNTRPYNASIFGAIKANDITRARQLLSSGQATIRDRDPNGKTLLHYAARACVDSDDAVTFLEQLISEGTDINSKDFSGWTAYNGLPSTNTIAQNSAKMRRLVQSYRLFIQHRNWPRPYPSAILLDSQVKSQSTTFELCLNPPSEILRLALNKVWPPWGTISLSERIEILIPMGRGDGYLVNPLAIRTCLDSGTFSSQFAQCEHKYQFSLACYIFAILALYIAQSETEESNGARHMLKDMLNIMGLDEFVGFVWRNRSPMQFFVKYWVESLLGRKSPISSARRVLSTSTQLRRYENLLQEGLQCYVTEMLLLGIDLDSLVSSESAKLSLHRLNPDRRDAVLHTIYDDNDRPYLRFRMLGFQYGPDPMDWHFYLSNPLDEWSAEFWDMIEHPERRMPGAWNDWR